MLYFPLQGQVAGLAPLSMVEDRSIEQQIADGDYSQDDAPLGTALQLKTMSVTTISGVKRSGLETWVRNRGSTSMVLEREGDGRRVTLEPGETLIIAEGERWVRVE